MISVHCTPTSQTDGWTDRSMTHHGITALYTAGALHGRSEVPVVSQLIAVLNTGLFWSQSWILLPWSWHSSLSVNYYGAPLKDTLHRIPMHIAT